MKKTVKCRLCGKKAKLFSAKNYVVWDRLHRHIIMHKFDGPMGGFECSSGHGCKNGNHFRKMEEHGHAEPSMVS